MRPLSRRQTIKGLGAASLFAGLAGSAALSTAALAQAVGWAKLKGQSIRVFWPDTPHFVLAKTLLPDFTAATGIKVELDMRPPSALRAAAREDLSRPFGSYDVVAYDSLWKTEFARRRYLADLEPLFKNADLAMPGYDLTDIVKSYLEGLGVAGGRRGYLTGPGAKVYGLPYSAECSVLGYRGDLFEKHKIAVPKTYDDLLAAIATVRQKEPGIGGLAARAKSGSEATTGWLMHLSPHGGSVIDDAFLPHVADQEAVEATRAYKLIVETGPAGTATFDGAAMTSAFLQGQAAMYLDGISIFGPASDPEKTKLISKLGFAVHPQAKAASGAMWGWGLGIPANAVRKEAGFVLLQWLTAKPQDVRITARGGLPIRLSTLDHPDVKKRYPVDLLRASIKLANPDWRPLIEEWEEISEHVLGPRIARMAAGSLGIEAGLQEASGEILKICQRAGYYRT